MKETSKEKMFKERGYKIKDNVNSIEVFLIEKERAIKIVNDKGDYITLDIPNKVGFNNMKRFLEESKK